MKTWHYYSRIEQKASEERLLHFEPESDEEYDNRELIPLTKAVGRLVVRAPDSEPEGMGSMPVPPNTLRVYTEYVLVKSVGPKVLWAESRVQGTGENFPPLQFHA
ncbi:uncharacterized protein TNCV_4158801 [Trichonephila clavipes]|nr:uncharacterized protein TNCV_4158801 [Trichonephila clavipes]